MDNFEHHEIIIQPKDLYTEKERAMWWAYKDIIYASGRKWIQDELLNLALHRTLSNLN